MLQHVVSSRKGREELELRRSRIPPPTKWGVAPYCRRHIVSNRTVPNAWVVEWCFFATNIIVGEAIPRPARLVSTPCLFFVHLELPLRNKLYLPNSDVVVGSPFVCNCRHKSPLGQRLQNIKSSFCQSKIRLSTQYAKNLSSTTAPNGDLSL